MSQEAQGGDISSGFGDSTVSGPVSDEKAEQMLHGDHDGPPREHPQQAAEGDSGGDGGQRVHPQEPAEGGSPS